MNELKRKALYGLGVLLKFASIVYGLILFGLMLSALLLDGIFGSTKQYPSEAADSKFVVDFLPFVLGGVLAFILGTYIKDRNQNLD